MKLGEILIAAYAYELYMWKPFRFLTELRKIIIIVSRPRLTRLGGMG